MLEKWDSPIVDANVKEGMSIVNQQFVRYCFEVK
jgi:hypothetical protein